MKLGRLDIENFMSIREAHTHLDHRGLVLIQGKNEDNDTFESNGAGKSTIFSEAIVWCLFGETIRGYKGDSVVNRFVGKNTRVSIEIIDDNGDVYQIIRHRKHKDYKNNVILIRNDITITGKSDTDTTVMIEDLLQMDFLSFTNSILFGQGISRMFASATDSEQKKILERMLRIEMFKDLQDKAKEHVSGITANLLQYTLQLSGAKDNKARLESHLGELQIKEATLYQEVAARLQSIDMEIINIKDSLVDLVVEADSLHTDRQQVGGLLHQLDKALLVYEDVVKKSDEVSEAIITGRTRLDRWTVDKQKAETKLANLRTKGAKPEYCDACGQPLAQEDTSEIEKHLQGTISNCDLIIADLMLDLDKWNAQLGEYKQKLDERKELSDSRSELSDEIKQIEFDIKNAETRRLTLTAQKDRLTKQREQEEERMSVTYGDLIEKAIADIKNEEEVIDMLNDQIADLEHQKSLYDFWVNAFGNQGIKSVMLDSVTPFLNKRANHYLSKLAGSSIEVEFTTQTELKSGEKKDKFAVQVKNANGDNDYKGNSNGEKRRIDLSVNLALQDLVGSRSNKAIDLIVYDECFEGLDGVGCENVIQLLQEKARTVGTVMVITHNESLKELFTKSIVVRKENQQTVIEEDE